MAAATPQSDLRSVGLGFFPLDDELQLLPGSLTPTLQENLVRLGAWMPFAQAGQLLADFMRLTSALFAIWKASW